MNIKSLKIRNESMFYPNDMITLWVKKNINFFLFMGFYY